MTSDYFAPSTRKPRPLIDLLVSIVIPSFILMKLSANADLGATRALLLALAFPLGWGLFELLKYRKLNFIALLGLISVLLTGGIGLLQLDTQWLAVKEAGIPGLIGLAVLISTYTRYPLIKTMVFNPALINVASVRQRLEELGTGQEFESRLQTANWLLGGTFFFSAVMNYLLAIWIVKSQAGSQAFNEELGRLTLLSYPMIAVPSTLMMLAVLYYLARALRQLAGMELTDIFTQAVDRS